MPSTQAPDVPSLPSMPQALIDYLRRLRTWAYQEIDDKIARTEAVPFVLLSASDEKNPTTVFKLSVDSSGAIQVTQVPLGRGKP